MFNYRVKETSSWIGKLVASHESGTIIGLPMSGKLRTIETAIDRLNLSDSFLVLDLSILPTRLTALTKTIRPKLEKFVADGGQILYLENCSITSKLRRRQLKVVTAIRNELKKKFICIFSFNEDISLYPDTLSRYSYLSSVNQNLFYFPYASDAEMSELISQNEARFNVNLTKSQVNEIHTQTGGVPYLVKSYFKDTQVTPDAINNLLSGFTSQQISYLKNKSPKVSESFHKLGITDSLGNIICPHIATAVQSFRLTSELVVDEEKSTLSVGKQKISDELMSYEKEIIFKLYSQNRMSREEIALICYGSKKSSNYSDYAIDKIISRLRLNLKRIGVNPKIIQTNRGFGYSLNTNVQ